MLAAALCGLVGGQGTTVAYEGFDYLSGGALAGGATGHGWSGAWAKAAISGAS